MNNSQDSQKKIKNLVNNHISILTRELSDEIGDFSGIDFEKSLAEMLRESLIRSRCEDRKNTINKIFNL
jgi:hypothetical protein